MWAVCMQCECVVATVVAGVLFMWVVYAIRTCSCWPIGRGAVYVGCVAAYFINNGL